MDWLGKIHAFDEKENHDKRQASTETGIDLWRWFVVEADRIYRSSPKAADSWSRCKGHEKAAEALCVAGDIPRARVELQKALVALQGLSMEQQNLL